MSRQNDTGSMDFMSGRLIDVRSFRAFNVIDDSSREELGIEVDVSLPALLFIRILERIFEWRGKPRTIRFDSGPEYFGHPLQVWPDKMFRCNTFNPASLNKMLMRSDSIALRGVNGVFAE